MAGLLAAIDLSAGSDEVAVAAIDIADRLGVPVTVLHVISVEEFERLRSERPQEHAFVDVVTEQHRVQIRSELEAELGSERAHAVEVHVAVGDPGEVVVSQIASGGFEFAAIGVRSRSRVSKLVFGSTAQSILLLSPVPVIAIPKRAA